VHYRQLTAVLILICSAIVILGVLQDRRVENKEYGFRVTIPSGFPVCYGDSGTHVHGVGTRLDKKACKDNRPGPSFSIWADYNANFMPTALEALRDNPECDDVPPAWAAAEWNNAIGGLRTAICRVDRPDGTTDLTLNAQAGKWPEGFEEETGKPYINYTVYFGTTKNRLENDLKTFKSFLKSIRIVEREFGR